MPIHYEKHGEIGVFTIDNGKVNVFTEEMHGALYIHLQDFLQDPSVKTGVLTGSENKCFCAGDDLSEGDSYGDGEGAAPKVMSLQRNKPIVAAINSWCLGQGFVYMILLTDIRIAGANARFGLPEISYGMGGASGAVRLSRHIPKAAANWIALTGQKLSADQAHRFHLINEVVSDDSVFDRAMAVAEMISAHPLAAIETEMECINHSGDLGPDEAMTFAYDLYERQLKAYHRQSGSKSGIEHVKSMG